MADSRLLNALAEALDNAASALLEISNEWFHDGDQLKLRGEVQKLRSAHTAIQAAVTAGAGRLMVPPPDQSVDTYLTNLLCDVEEASKASGCAECTMPEDSERGWCYRPANSFMFTEPDIDVRRLYRFSELSESLSEAAARLRNQLLVVNGRKLAEISDAWATMLTDMCPTQTTETPGAAVCDHVFISYSHSDKKWLTDLLTHLKPYLRHNLITAWSDQQIRTGSKWLPDIQAALARARVAVLLVTPSFLASDFIHEHELTPALKEAELGGVRIVWIPVRACGYEKTSLRDFQAAIPPDKPLATMKANRDEAWVTICQQIEKAVKQE